MDHYAELKWAANRWMDVIWAERNLEAFDLLHAPDFIDRSPAGREGDPASYKQSIRNLYEAFPDFYTKVKDLVVDVDKDKVAIRWQAEGTHRGAFMGFEPSGRRITFCGIEIVRIDTQARIVERWGEWDGLDLLEQLQG